MFIVETWSYLFKNTWSLFYIHVIPCVLQAFRKRLWRTLFCRLTTICHPIPCFHLSKIWFYLIPFCKISYHNLWYVPYKDNTRWRFLVTHTLLVNDTSGSASCLPSVGRRIRAICGQDSGYLRCVRFQFFGILITVCNCLEKRTPICANKLNKHECTNPLLLKLDLIQLIQFIQPNWFKIWEKSFCDQLEPCYYCVKAV